MRVELDEGIVGITRTAVSRASDGAARKSVPLPVELVHPPHHGVRSGGHVYNEQLLEAARRRGIDWSSRQVEVSEIEATFGERTVKLRIWDSLFLESLAAWDLTHKKPWGLLLHYLPSHDPTLDDAERGRLARVEERVIPAAPLVIVTGSEPKRSVEGIHPGARVFLCEPGVSLPFLEPARETTKRAPGVLDLLTVANFVAAKGLLELLLALSRVSHVEWRWHVIGDFTRDAVYTSRFDDAARRLGLTARIVRHGTLDPQAIARLMDDMDVFVFASRFEAYGMALAEAAARCLPAVTTDVGAATSLYSHGTTGLIAAVNDGEAFAKHLERLMCDSALRQRFRENLRGSRPRTWQDTLDAFMTAVATLG
jgi:glycosyltransferase involved in cell wall biosynthesis